MILDASQSSGGSTSSAQSSSWSNVAGNAATDRAIQNAATANSSAMSAWREAAEYNAEQARIQREWQERMANTVYQRTVKDMTAAGINPVLAAQMGLGTASVGSGAQASISSPDNYMARTFAEQNSASQSSSQGQSWNQSESGLATALTQIGSMVMGWIDAIHGSQQVNISLNGIQEWAKENPSQAKTVKEALVGDRIVPRKIYEAITGAASAGATAGKPRK